MPHFGSLELKLHVIGNSRGIDGNLSLTVSCLCLESCCVGHLLFNVHFAVGMRVLLRTVAAILAHLKSSGLDRRASMHKCPYTHDWC
jgi:hypothetical protein